MRARLLALSLLPLALAACKPTTPVVPEPALPATSTASPAAAATAPATAPDDNLNAVLWVQRSAEYRALAMQSYRAAADHLDAALAETHWDALVPEERDNAEATAGLPPAVILDVDETVLDNSPYQARLVRDGLEYDEVTWAAWVAEKKARAVPGVVEFAKAAQAKGVTLLYLSNRAEHLQDATLANLRAEGLPVKDDSVFLGLGIFVEGCEQNGSEKLCRRRLAGRQYRVLMQFGDQLGDFAEIVANTPQARAELLEAHRDWFGERWWMLPNPTYGSWEPAVFNNAWDQPREARRQAKREALEFSQ
jgi:acid phosphatase